MRKRILATLTVLCLALSLLTTGVSADLGYDDNVSEGYVFTMEARDKGLVNDFGVAADGWYGFEVSPMPSDRYSAHIWEYTTGEYDAVGVQKQWIAHDTIFAVELSKSKVYALEIEESGNYTVTVHFYGDKIPDSALNGYEIDLSALWARGFETELDIQDSGVAWLTLKGNNVPKSLKYYFYMEDGELASDYAENDGNGKFILSMVLLARGTVFFNSPAETDSAAAADTPTDIASAPLEVVPTRQNLTVDGETKNAEIYNINGANYFKLRDMAMLLNGTGSRFSVDFDAARNTVVVKTGAAYTPVGGELAAGRDNSASAVASPQSVEVDGEIVDLTAYNIGGSNFFKLRDLGSALGFDVDYDGATATMLVTSR